MPWLSKPETQPKCHWELVARGVVAEGPLLDDSKSSQGTAFYKVKVFTA